MRLVDVCLALVLFSVMAQLFVEYPLMYGAALALVTLWGLASAVDARSKPSTWFGNLVAMGTLAVLLLVVGVSESVLLFVGLYVQSVCFKLLIARKDRQYRSVALLTLLATCLVFLFKQDLLASVLAMINLVLVLMALFALVTHADMAPAAKQASISVLYTLPLGLVLFMVLPRLPAFWQLPSTGSAKTGLATEVNPYSISQLADSDELVFSAEFLRGTPTMPLYWRAMVHEGYQNNTWRVLPSRELNGDDDFGPATHIMSIMAEPSAIPWLYGLGASFSNTQILKTTEDGLVKRSRLLGQTVQYEVTSVYPLSQSAAFKETLSEESLRANTSISKTDNPKAIALAHSLKNQYGSPKAQIAALWQYYQNNGFRYTLSPPVYNQANAIDAFLFEGRAGFCGHYANATAFIIRQLGIPARVVSGYLGGEPDESTGRIKVYQYDAHAWVEYWQPGSGWQRFDATAVVAPDRLNGSLSQSRSLEQEFQDNLSFGFRKLSNIAMFNWLRLHLEQWDYEWTHWVLSFDNDKQNSLFNRIFGGDSALSRAGVFLGALLASAFIVAVLVLLARKRNYKPLDKELLTLVRFGIKTGTLEPSADLSNRTASQILTPLMKRYPNKQSECEAFLTLFNQIRYKEQPLSASQQTAARRLIKTITE